MSSKLPSNPYKKPQPCPTPTFAGFPEKVANTQTLKTRGTGAATKGTKSSDRMA